MLKCITRKSLTFEESKTSRNQGIQSIEKREIDWQDTNNERYSGRRNSRNRFSRSQTDEIREETPVPGGDRSQKGNQRTRGDARLALEQKESECARAPRDQNNGSYGNGTKGEDQQNQRNQSTEPTSIQNSDGEPVARFCETIQDFTSAIKRCGTQRVHANDHTREVLNLMRENSGTRMILIVNSELMRQDLFTRESECLEAHFGINPIENHESKESTDESAECNVMIRNIEERIQNFNRPGSNCRFQRVLSLDVHFIDYLSSKEPSYMKLPTEINQKRESGDQATEEYQGRHNLNVVQRQDTPTQYK